MNYRLTGLIAATYTPLDSHGRLNLEPVPRIVDRLVAEGIRGLYVCGSTGEGMSLAGVERRQVAEAYTKAAAGRVPVIIQVGHNSIAEAVELAKHAQGIGADVISATAPSYFKVGSIEILTDCMAEIAAAAPDLPFYYYHIPTLTGAALDMPDFLQAAGSRIPNLVGIKYTSPTVFEYQSCLELDGGRFDIPWGCDEMLLSALIAGAQAAIGSTYNIAAPLYQRIIAAYEAGQLVEARQLQSLSVQMVRTIAQWPFHSAMKEILKMLGEDCGSCRLPQPRLSSEQTTDLRAALDAIGFFDWARS